MWILPSPEVFLTALATWLGIRAVMKAGEKGIGWLYQSFAGVPSSKVELIAYGSGQRMEACSLLSGSEKVILDAMKIAYRSRQEELLERLDRAVKKFSGLRDSIKYVNSPDEQESIAVVKRLGYIDLILCCDSFDISLTARDCLELVERGKWEEAKAKVDSMDASWRRANDLLSIRSFLASSEKPREVLKTLRERHPEAYYRIDGAVKLASFAEELKSPGWPHREKYYKELGRRGLNVARKFLDNGRSAVSFSEFHSEFERTELAKVSEDDLEKSLVMLASEGQIGGIVQGAVILESEAASRERVAKLVREDPSIWKDGLTPEALTEMTGWPRDYVFRVLNSLEEEGTARRVADAAVGMKWYFPGLKKPAKARGWAMRDE